MLSIFFACILELDIWKSYSGYHILHLHGKAYARRAHLRRFSGKNSLALNFIFI